MPTPHAIRPAVLSVAMTATLKLMGCSNRPMSNVATDKVDQLFATRNKPGSPGCSVAISRNGQLVYERGYGMATSSSAFRLRRHLSSKPRRFPSSSRR